MSADEKTTTVRTELQVPGDVIVEGTIMVVSWFDGEGAQRYGWQTRGEFSVATGLGLLEIVKAHMLAGVE